MYGIYIKAQNGFRRGRGTVDSAFVLYSIVNEYLEQGKKLYTFFIDYGKAFDYIVHDNLWYKLLNLGVQGKILTSFVLCIAKFGPKYLITMKSRKHSRVN